MTVYSVRIMRSDERTRPPLQLLTHYRDTPPADSVLDPRLDDATNGALFTLGLYLTRACNKEAFVLNLL